MAGQILIRDLSERDRAAFVHYQTDPRYLSLYGFEEDPERPNGLFDKFLAWQREVPRRNFQLGIFDARSDRLLGCAGLRRTQECAAIMGIELAPAEWGRFRRATDASVALLSYGFDVLELDVVLGNTGSGNRRIEKLARWFGGELVNDREGPEWMKARGWREVDWSLSRATWQLKKELLARRVYS